MGAPHLLAPRSQTREPVGSRPHAQRCGRGADPGARHVRALVPLGLRRCGGEVRRRVHGEHQLDERGPAPSGSRAINGRNGPMKSQALKHTIVFLGLAAIVAAPVTTRAADPDWKAVEQTLGKPGQLQPGDVFRIGMPRTDLAVTVKGVPVKAGFALGSYAAFKQVGDRAMVMGDLVLLDQEVPAVMSGLFSSGLEVDRKSTRLNSSHLVISYAVFCLKKKKKTKQRHRCLGSR